MVLSDKTEPKEYVEKRVTKSRKVVTFSPSYARQLRLLTGQNLSRIVMPRCTQVRSESKVREMVTLKRYGGLVCTLRWSELEKIRAFFSLPRLETEELSFFPPDVLERCRLAYSCVRQALLREDKNHQNVPVEFMKWRVNGYLGSGSEGLVLWMGPTRRQNYAVKFMQPSTSFNVFENEVRASEWAHRANLGPRVWSSFRVGGLGVIASDQMDLTLDRYFSVVETMPKERRTVYLDHAMRVYRQFLSHLDQLDVTHGDLHSSNLMLRRVTDKRGQSRVVVKAIDYGRTYTNGYVNRLDALVFMRSVEIYHSKEFCDQVRARLPASLALDNPDHDVVPFLFEEYRSWLENQRVLPSPKHELPSPAREAWWLCARSKMRAYAEEADRTSTRPGDLPPSGLHDKYQALLGPDPPATERVLCHEQETYVGLVRRATGLHVARCSCLENVEETTATQNYAARALLGLHAKTVPAYSVTLWVSETPVWMSLGELLTVLGRRTPEERRPVVRRVLEALERVLLQLRRMHMTHGLMEQLHTAVFVCPTPQKKNRWCLKLFRCEKTVWNSCFPNYDLAKTLLGLWNCAPYLWQDVKRHPLPLISRAVPGEDIPGAAQSADSVTYEMLVRQNNFPTPKEDKRVRRCVLQGALQLWPQLVPEQGKEKHTRLHTLASDPDYVCWRVSEAFRRQLARFWGLANADSVSRSFVLPVSVKPMKWATLLNRRTGEGKGRDGRPHLTTERLTRVVRTLKSLEPRAYLSALTFPFRRARGLSALRSVLLRTVLSPFPHLVARVRRFLLDSVELRDQDQLVFVFRQRQPFYMYLRVGPAESLGWQHCVTTTAWAHRQGWAPQFGPVFRSPAVSAAAHLCPVWYWTLRQATAENAPAVWRKRLPLSRVAQNINALLGALEQNRVTQGRFTLDNLVYVIETKDDTTVPTFRLQLVEWDRTLRRRCLPDYDRLTLCHSLYWGSGVSLAFLQALASSWGVESAPLAYFRDEVQKDWPVDSVTDYADYQSQEMAEVSP